MCTSVLFRNGNHSFFGRNLDLQYQLANDVTVCPRNYVLPYHHLPDMPHHPAIVGMAITGYGYPLFFEGINEYGVGVASLNFPGYGQYAKQPVEGKTNVTSFELIPYLLSTCRSLEDAKRELANLNIVADAFNDRIQSVPLHWICCDKTGSVVVEMTATGLHVYDNDLNVLANAPEYPTQAVNVANYLNLTPEYPHNRIMPDVTVPVYSSGMGSDGLPGGLDSMSRFVRAAFMLNSSKAEDTEAATVNQFFRIMQTVEQIKGANREKDGFDEITNYTAGADLETMDFYWTTYDNQQINALHTRAQDLDSNTLLVYPVSHDQNIHWIG